MGKKISALEFKRLLCDIRDRRPDVRVRLRILGKMWGEQFCSIDVISGNELVLHEESRDQYLHINNINDVIQFELECSFFGYHAFYHYDILAAGAPETLRSKVL